VRGIQFGKIKDPEIEKVYVSNNRFMLLSTTFRIEISLLVNRKKSHEKSKIIFSDVDVVNFDGLLFRNNRQGH